MSETRANPELQRICSSAIQAVFPSFRGQEIEAGFYPYIGLTHTIRRRESRWILRISDHCRHAPRPVFEAIALILAYKVRRRRPPQRVVEIYERFRRDPVIEKEVSDRRRLKGRKQIADPEGRHHSLAALYREVNQRFFGDRVEVRRLGWGIRRSWIRLGHYDPDHQSITISPVLDSPRVPGEVIAYLLYHEMLHALFGESSHRGAGRHHPPEFQKADRAYPGYRSIKKFLDDYSRSRGKRVRKITNHPPEEA